MAVLSEEEVKILLQKVLGFSKANTCEVRMYGGVAGHIRFARNNVTGGGKLEDIAITVQSSFGKKVGMASTNRYDDSSLQNVVGISEELASLSPERQEYVEPIGQGQYSPQEIISRPFSAVAPEYRSEIAAHCIARAKGMDAVAAGFWEDRNYFSAIMNSKGLFAYYAGADYDFSLTMSTNEGHGAGWVKFDHFDLEKFNLKEIVGVAAKQASMSKDPKAIEPGKYTVILGPAASVGLISNMMGQIQARYADEGRSFLSKKGGGNRLGEKIFDQRITIYSDPLNALVPTPTWDECGRPRSKVVWVENGVVKNMAYDPYWASKKGVGPVPGPANIIFEGNNTSMADMIKNTMSGILVTRLDNISLMDQKKLLYTGITRDGTFYIENGKIRFPIKNFRFIDSPLAILDNLEDIGAPERIDGNLIPPLKIRDFNFTSLSESI